MKREHLIELPNKLQVLNLKSSQGGATLFRNLQARQVQAALEEKVVRIIYPTKDENK